MVADQEFALRVDAEAGDLEGVGDLLVPVDLLAVVLERPDLAGRVVAVDVGPAQIGELLAVVDDAAGQRPRLGVVDAPRSA